MAKLEVTGRPAESDSEDDLMDLREDYEGTPNHEDGVKFEEAYCLSPIRLQPDDYDGPKRFCVTHTLRGVVDYCQFHEHFRKLNEYTEENPNEVKYRNMKHGAYSALESIKDTMSEREQDLYEWVVDEWADYYNIEDPAMLDTLHSTALMIVKRNRVNLFLEDEDGKGIEIIRTEFSPQGDAVEKPEAHHLQSEIRAISRDIEKMKDTLGVTAKHKDNVAARQSETNKLDEIVDVANESLDSDNHDFDPERHSEDTVADGGGEGNGG